MSVSVKPVIPVIYLEKGVETVPELFFEHYDCPKIIQMNNPVGTGWNSYFKDIDVPIGSLRLNAKEEWFVRRNHTKRDGAWHNDWAILGTLYLICNKEGNLRLYTGKTQNTLEHRKKLHLSEYKRSFGAEPLLHDYIRDECGGDWDQVVFKTLYEVPKENLERIENIMVKFFDTPLNAVPGGTGRGKKRKYSNPVFGSVCWDKSRKRFKACWQDSSGKKHLLYHGDSIDDAYAAVTAEYEKQLAEDTTDRLDGVKPRPLQYYKTHIANKYPDDAHYFDWI